MVCSQQLLLRVLLPLLAEPWTQLILYQITTRQSWSKFMYSTARQLQGSCSSMHTHLCAKWAA